MLTDAQRQHILSLAVPNMPHLMARPGCEAELSRYLQTIPFATRFWRTLHAPQPRLPFEVLQTERRYRLRLARIDYARTQANLRYDGCLDPDLKPVEER